MKLQHNINNYLIIILPDFELYAKTTVIMLVNHTTHSIWVHGVRIDIYFRDILLC